MPVSRTGGTSLSPGQHYRNGSVRGGNRFARVSPVIVKGHASRSRDNGRPGDDADVESGVRPDFGSAFLALVAKEPGKS